MAALTPRHRCFCSTHSENAEKASHSYEVMARYAATASPGGAAARASSPALQVGSVTQAITSARQCRTIHHSVPGPRPFKASTDSWGKPPASRMTARAARASSEWARAHRPAAMPAAARAAAVRVQGKTAARRPSREDGYARTPPARHREAVRSGPQPRGATVGTAAREGRASSARAAAPLGPASGTDATTTPSAPSKAASQAAPLVPSSSSTVSPMAASAQARRSPSCARTAAQVASPLATGEARPARHRATRRMRGPVGGSAGSAGGCCCCCWPGAAVAVGGGGGWRPAGRARAAWRAWAAGVQIGRAHV